MALWSVLVIVLALTSEVTHVQADYDCLCNYAVETAIYSAPTSTAAIRGYLYKFNCRAIHGTTDPRWTEIVFNKQVGYVLKSNKQQNLVCQASPPDSQKLTTTTPGPTTSTRMPTTTTTTRTTTTTTKRPTTTSKKPITKRPTTPTTTTTTTTKRSITAATTTTTTTQKPTTTTKRPTTTTTTTKRPTTRRTKRPTTTTTTTKRPTTTTTTTEMPTTTTTTTRRPTTTTTTTKRPTTTTTTTRRPTTTTTTTKRPTTTTTTTVRPTTTTTTKRPTTTTTTNRPTTTTTRRPTTTTTTTKRPTTTTTTTKRPKTTTKRPTTTTTTTKRPTTTTTTTKIPTTTTTTTKRPTTTTTTRTTTTKRPTTERPVVTHHTPNIHTCSRKVILAARHNRGLLAGYGASCYEIVPKQATWRAAEHDCVSKGGHLLHIASKQEEIFVMSFMHHYNFKFAVWTGLNDIHHEERFVWSSGNPVTFSQWYPARRNNSTLHGLEDCVVLVPYLYTRARVGSTNVYTYGYWDDIKCNSANPWICRYPAVKGTYAPTNPPQTHHHIIIGHGSAPVITFVG